MVTFGFYLQLLKDIVEMNSNPLVTIITPSFNQGQFVEETIKSAFNQTYPNIEYIFVDGGSTDETMEIVEKYRDKIDVIIHEKDKGQADAINKGFKLAKGELVGWINSDDILYPECVEKIVDLYYKYPNADIYYHSWNKIINRDGELIKNYQRIISSYEYLLKNDYRVIQPGSFYKLKSVYRAGLLDESVYYCMDLDLWLKLLKHGQIVYTNDMPHSAIRLYDGTKTDTGKGKFLKNIYDVLRKHGARWYYRSIWQRIFIYYFKLKVKKILY